MKKNEKPDKFISQVAANMGVRASTLRFWESEGLVTFERNGENNYRTPSLQNLLQVFDVVLYRSLDMPIEKIKSYFGADLDAMQALLNDDLNAVADKIAALQHTAQRIREREKAVSRARSLSGSGQVTVNAALPAFRPFTYDSRADIELMLRDCTLTGLHRRTGEEKHEFISFDESRVMPEKEYVFGLLKVDTDTQEMLNAEDFRTYAARLGRTSGDMFGRYLTTAAENGVRRDLYEGYLELE